MKKTIVFFWLTMLTISLFAYTWIPFCPDTIDANNICFGVGSWKGLICHDDGMYLWEDDIEEWSFYTYWGLPVTGAAYLDETRILVAMGDGSYSDGVYTFHLQTHDFQVVEWMVNPNFLIYYEETGTYYVGSQFGGLFQSTDGWTWTLNPYFTNKSCVVMDCFENHLVVSEVSNIYNIHWSDDYGDTWQEAAAGAPIITDLRFSYGGDLFGIFPDGSDSSGLWYSDDYGNTWEVAFYSENMCAVGFDALNTIFVGWEEPYAGNEGIAIYNPLAPPPGLTFLNEGLPSTNIHKILLNPAMSAVAIFCCTDEGVWLSYDYMVGEEEHQFKSNGVVIFPNPVSNQATIKINLSELTKENISIPILNNQGQKVDEIKVEGNNSEEIFIKWNKGNLPAGVYYLVIETVKKQISEKFIIL